MKKIPSSLTFLSLLICLSGCKSTSIHVPKSVTNPVTVVLNTAKHSGSNILVGSPLSDDTLDASAEAAALAELEAEGGLPLSDDALDADAEAAALRELESEQ